MRECSANPDPRIRPALLVLALLALIAVPAGAKPDVPSFQDTTQVVSIEVPVEVIGRDGLPVRGLKADDFTVFDDGARQPLKSFRVVDLDRLEPRGKPIAAEALELDAGARRHFLLLFDLSFARPAAVLRARQAALDLVLHSLRPTDLAAVATYSLQNGARLVVTFTSDRAQLARGIQSLGLDKVFDTNKSDPLRFVIAPPTIADLAGGGTPVRSQSRNANDSVVAESLDEMRRANERVDRSIGRDTVKSFMQSLADLAKVLGQLKGRKHVILFSEGFDSRLLVGHDTDSQEAATDNFNAAFGELWKVDNDTRYGNTQLQGELARMLREFKRADAVIEAVNIAGLRAGGDASEAGVGTRVNGDEGLFEMADGTGGALFKDANNFKTQLDQVLDRTTVTYLLSFERSDLKDDGAFHRLEVKARMPPGARISYRTGYYGPRPFRELDPLEKVLLASESVASASPRSDLDMNVLISSFRESAGKAYVPVIVEVPGQRLIAASRGDHVNIEIYAYVSDQHGEMQDFFTQKVAVDLKKGKDALAEGLKYYGHVDLRPGNYRVRILVRDSDSGATAVQTERLSIPAWDAGQPVLLPPFFIDSRSGWLMVRERSADAAKKGAVLYPFTVNGEPYVPAALPELAGDQAAKLCLVAYNLGAGDLALQGNVVGADGAPHAGGSLRLVARTATGVSGFDKLLATFQPTGLDAGRYTLQVAVTDPRTGHKEMSSVPFQVVH
jgi:VWFA-related protein